MNAADFSEFAAAVSAGAYLLLGGWFICTRFTRRAMTWQSRYLRNLSWFQGALAVVVFAAAGLVVSAFSNWAADRRCIFGSICGLVLPLEADIRREALFGACSPTACDVDPLAIELAAVGAFATLAGPIGAQLDAALISQSPRSNNPISSPLLRDDVLLRDVARAAYYAAKNRSYFEETYFQELSAIQRQIDLSRSLTLVSVLLAALAICRLLWDLSKTWTPLLWAASSYSGSGCYGAMSTAYQRAISNLLVVLVIILAFYANRFAFAENEREFDRRAFGYWSGILAKDHPKPRPQGDLVGVSAILALPPLVTRFGSVPDVFLAVTDAKAASAQSFEGPERGGGSERAAKSLVPIAGSSHMAIVVLSDSAPALVWPIVTDWSQVGVTGSDIESACWVPGSSRDFIGVESGSRREPEQSGREARAFLFEYVPTPFPGLATAKHAWRLALDGDEVEGIYCWQNDEGYVHIVTANRSPGSNGQIELYSYLLAPPGQGPSVAIPRSTMETVPVVDLLPRRTSRVVSDLLLMRDGRVLAAATLDEGRGANRFTSVIYDIGTFTPSGELSVGDLRILGVIDGFKVEGLAQGHTGSVLIATDDENEESVFRFLPQQ